MQSITREQATYPGYRGTTPQETVIGTVTVTEAYDYKTMEQTACNYYMIRVEPGVYEVCKTRDWTFVRIEGTIVDEYFVNRLFTASSVAEKRDIGKRSTRATRQLDHYAAAREFATNPDWELASDWKIETTSHTSSHDGRAFKIHKLVGPPAS